MSAALLGLAFRARMDSQTAKLVLLKLVDCCDDEGRRIYPSVAVLADEAECSPRTVQRTLRVFCAVGLLRLVREGGRGKRSTNCYEMDIDLLARFRTPGVFATLAAGCDAMACDDASGGDEAETGAETGAETHAEHAEHDAERAGSDANSKGDTVSPYAVRVTMATSQGDTMVSPNPSRESLKPEREGAGASATGVSSGDGGGGGNRAGLTEDGEAEPAGATLDAFRKVWPNIGLDDQAKLEAAWAALPFPVRRAAIDGVAPFLAALKTAGKKHAPASWNYLAQRRWTLIETVAPKPAAPVHLKPWSDDWWAVLLRRIRAGERTRLMLSWAIDGRGVDVPADQVPMQSEISALAAFPCDGPELEAWRPWFSARGCDLPRFRGSFRVFLPGPEPPAGAGMVRMGDL